VVISPITGGLIYVILGEGETCPEKFNTTTCVVFRRDKSTNQELHLLKAAGEVGPPTLTEKPKPVCNYSGDGNPLHEHADGTFWHFDRDFSLENGPFKTYQEAYAALTAYCEGIVEAENFLTMVDDFVRMNGLEAANEDNATGQVLGGDDSVDPRTGSGTTGADSGVEEIEEG
jgi:hypothetical protein